MFSFVSLSNSTKLMSYYESNIGKLFNYLQHSKTSYSFELLTGLTNVEIQKKYEILTGIIIAANGKIQGSHLDSDPTTGNPGMLVYYEIPQGRIIEVKRKFNSSIKNMVLM